MNKFIILALLIVGALSMQTKTASDECSFGREAILLHNIKELEFTSGKFTASRRVAAISQVFLTHSTNTPAQLDSPSPSIITSSSLLLFHIFTSSIARMYWRISTWKPRAGCSEVFQCWSIWYVQPNTTPHHHYITAHITLHHITLTVPPTS